MISRNQALALDAIDPLKDFRQQFILPEKIIYLDGNSLGALPKRTPIYLQEIIQKQWGEDLIKSWNLHNWIHWPQTVGTKIARLIGAKPHEVIVADSTSVNLFKLLAGALKLRPDRRTILSEKSNFPTDLYMAQGLLALLEKDYQLKIVEREMLIESIDHSVALVMVTEVNYLTGHRHNLKTLAEAAHGQGALILVDLAHSAGAMPVDLNQNSIDLAVGCGYKYLNGGPGAPAYLYISEALQADFPAFLAGWLGHADPFAFTENYVPAFGMNRHLCGTPPILSLAALDCGLNICLEADLQAIRQKSLALGDLFIDQVEAHCPELVLATPRDPERRGSQVSFHHSHGYAVMQALIAQGVIGDFRSPDIIRFGFAPLYNRYVDIWDAADQLCEILKNRTWSEPQFQQRQTVT
ncbi:MAG: kynureninase [Anaerolineae bacterium]|nr:kynureninase [Gloeobacterales cyanobacterium ES-bin-313]